MLMGSPVCEAQELTAPVLLQVNKIHEAAGLSGCCVWTEFDENFYLFCVFLVRFCSANALFLLLQGLSCIH